MMNYIERREYECIMAEIERIIYRQICNEIKPKLKEYIQVKMSINFRAPGLLIDSTLREYI